MRIDFTVRGPGGQRDVALTAPPATPVDAVLPDLARSCGADPGAAAWLGPRELRGTLENCGLRTGSVVSFAPQPGALPTGLHTVRVVGGPMAGAAVPLRRDGVVVGRDPDCDVVLADDRASRRHAVLQAGRGGVTVRDLQSTNGTTIDGLPVPTAGCLVEPGGLIRVGDSLLAVTAPEPQLRAALLRGADGAVAVNRAPRSPAAPAAVTIDCAARPTPPPRGRVPWFAALVPAVAGGALAWLLSSPLFLLFALLSPVLLLGTAVSDRLHWRRERRRAETLTRRADAAVDARVTAALRAETAARRSQFPDPFTVLEIADLPGRRLWEREPGDPDHLAVRVGSADVASTTLVRAADGLTAAGVLPSVPVTVDLRAGPLGVAGPAADEIARWLIGQLAVLQAPAEVDIVPVVEPSDDRWAWCRWLPHVRVAPLPRHDTVATALAALAALRDRRRAEPGGAWSGPWTVVVADRLTGPDAAALAALLLDGAAHGITAVCVAESAAAVPAACRSTVVADPASGCRATLRGPAGDLTLVTDRVSTAWAEHLARMLAPLTDVRAGAALPRTCRLADVVPATAGHDPSEVAHAWGGSDGGARTVIGVGRDGPVTIDLVADGPHALVAGTTGSGKSELLRSLVVGLAAAYPPDELSFLLVDYKGGAAFAEAARLPHTTGVLTDLDAPLTARALQSLHAELRRRERLLAAAGADDLPGYRQWRRRHDGAALARLVIVVDEFAELATDLPDFVTGLVGVARRGRSLGVHLVLATQRPGSVVSAEIRANTALRIALRVTEPIESSDVIGVPDAALVDPAVAGRAYARIGARLIELQTARVTADHTAAHPVVETLGAWRRPAHRVDRGGADPELRRVVDLLVRAARVAGSQPPHPPWLPPLPARVPLAELDTPDIDVPLGRLDHPAEQMQPVFGIDPAGDSVLVVGRSRSGRTTTLVTAAVAAARRLAPDELEVHLIDGSGALADTIAPLPHLATSVTRHGLELVPRLLHRLASRLPPPEGRRRTLLLVDDWDLVTGSVDDATAAGWSELLTTVVRTTGPDLSVLVSGGRTLLLPRVAAGFASRLVLPLADVTDYGMAGLSSAAIPTLSEPGAGVRVPDGAVFRIAHAGTEPTLAAAHAAAAGLAMRWSGRPPAVNRIRLRPLPGRVTVADVRAQVVGRGSDGLALGLVGDSADPCVVDVVGRRARLLVAGPPRSGRSTLLMTITTEARRAGQAVAVVAPSRSPLRSHARSLGATLLDDASAPPPRRPTLLAVDDVDTCDEHLADTMVGWLRDPAAPVGAVVAGRSDELAATYRGLVAEVRRDRYGVLLRPGPLDGELLGVRVRPRVGIAPPGRGVVVGDPRWGAVFAEGDTVPIQVACP